MNQDMLKGHWRQLKGQIKQQWGRLTDDDLDQAQGNWDKLVGRLQERYGLSKNDANRKLDEWMGQYKSEQESSTASSNQSQSNAGRQRKQ